MKEVSVSRDAQKRREWKNRDLAAGSQGRKHSGNSVNIPPPTPTPNKHNSWPHRTKAANRLCDWLVVCASLKGTEGKEACLCAYSLVLCVPECHHYRGAESTRNNKRCQTNRTNRSGKKNLMDKCLKETLSAARFIIPDTNNIEDNWYK